MSDSEYTYAQAYVEIVKELDETKKALDLLVAIIRKMPACKTDTLNDDEIRFLHDLVEKAETKEKVRDFLLGEGRLALEKSLKAALAPELGRTT